MNSGIARVQDRISEIRDRIGELVKNAPPASGTETEGEFTRILTEENDALSKAPTELRQPILDASRKHMIPAAIVDAVIRHESNYKPNAVSRAGAQGLMQLMPGTQKILGVKDPFDPVQSIEGGTRYLRMMSDRFGGNVEKMLAAYNAGPNAVERHGGIPPYAETQNYVRKIMADLASGFESEE